MSAAGRDAEAVLGYGVTMRVVPAMFALLTACNPDVRGPDAGDTDAVQDACRETPLPSGGPRIVAVSHPYSASGAQADAWELFSLDGDVLTPTGTTMSLGRGYNGAVAWAPDGSLAVTVHDDGTLGVFTADGAVVEAAWDGGFYASDATFDATGERLFVVDGNWVNNGGGVYEVAIDCDSGVPSLVGKVVDSKLGSHLFGDVLVADSAAAILDVDAGELGAAVPLFDYADAIVGGASRHEDTLYVGDYSEFSGVENRVAVATLGAAVTKVGEVVVLDPYAIAAVEGGAVVSSGYGNEIVGLTASGIADRLDSELPGAVTVGPDGLVLVAELSSIRLVRFDGATLEDVDTYVLGDGLDRMPGSIGVQP